MTSAALINAEDAWRFLTALLPNAGAGLRLRGVGEKGTANEKFSESIETHHSNLRRHFERWTMNSAGCFVVPAYIRPDAPLSPKEEDIEAFTSVIVDLDDESTAPKAEHFLRTILGPPSIVVASSGPGSAKRHLYWLLDEPTEGADEVRRVASIRKYLAELVGGDAAFGRVPQIIRIPGTVNGKNGGARPVELLSCDPSITTNLDTIEENLLEAERPAWAPPPKVQKRITDDQGRLLFTPDTGSDSSKRPLAETMSSQVHEGGAEVNRWGEFSRVAGHYIHQARLGVVDAEAARELCRGWMLANMVPPWPDDRFDKEWHGLLERDVQANGTMPPKAQPLMPVRALSSGPSVAVSVSVTVGGQEETAQAIEPRDPGEGLRVWAAHRWSMGERPKRRWHVQGLVAAAKPHLLVAEGGAGKTFSLLDLGLKLTAPRMGDRWLGQIVNRPNEGEPDRTAVIFTAEDDQEELHIRMEDMDPGGDRRRRAGDRFIVVPLLSAGGVFRLVERDPKTGVPRASPAYEETLALLRDLKPDVVGIDTVAATMHGDENASVIAQEWAAAAGRICGELGAAMVATHHMRKADRTRRASKNAPPRTIEDVKEDIRGSNALIGSARMVIVLYQPDDWAHRLKEMGETATRGRLWRMGVAKANNPEAMQGERTLIRTKVGTLEDATERDVVAQDLPLPEEELAWLAWIIEKAAADQMPFTETGASGIYERREELPTDRLKVEAKRTTHGNKSVKVREGIELLIKRGTIVRTSKGNMLDVAGGPIANGAQRRPGAFTPPDHTRYQYDEQRGMIAQILEV